MYPIQNNAVELEFANFLGFFFFIIAIVLTIIYTSNFLSFENPDAFKLSQYECGFEPYADARDRIDVRFYLVAILFLIFDLEAAYFLPWVASFSFINVNGVFLMIDFILELFAGYIYAWSLGALNWK